MNSKTFVKQVFIHATAMLILLIVSVPLFATIAVRDDEGNVVELPQPAQRVIALAPHVVENVFAIGAGEQLIAAVEYSDYPSAAQELPRVGRFNTFDIEAIVALKPDLVIAWGSGNGDKIIATLRRFGIPVYVDEPKNLTDIDRSLRHYGILLGREHRANEVADNFSTGVAALASHYHDKKTVKVFYQIWHDPLQTINHQHVIGRVIELCGGENIFSDAVALAPTISVEALLQRNPQVIIASGEGAQAPVWLKEWQRWRSVSAVQRDHIYHLHPDFIQRHTPRILEGATQMCEFIDRARQE